MNNIILLFNCYCINNVPASGAATNSVPTGSGTKDSSGPSSGSPASDEATLPGDSASSSNEAKTSSVPDASSSEAVAENSTWQHIEG